MIAFVTQGALIISSTSFMVMHNDYPLWDGAGCGLANTCCSLNNPPWFYKHTSTTMSDNIEMRICSDQNVDNEDTPIETIELYVK